MRKCFSGMAFVLAGLVIGGCAASGGASSSSATSDAGSVDAHDNMDAVVWLQTSNEFAAVTEGIYATATTALVDLARDRADNSTPMAIVMDVDETVLNNVRYQAQLILDNTVYESDTWDDWIAMQAATAIPGVVDFIRTGQSLGVKFFLVTNRTCIVRDNESETCPQKQETLDNLTAVGIDSSLDSLYFRDDIPPAQCRALLTADEQADGLWSTDKTSRRACVELDHDIVMLFGDQLGDFVEEAAGDSHGEGADHSEHWGKTWFMLPNPTYGGWRPREFSDKQSLIRGVQ